jgi:transglutaminase-like putative cysteine protease
MLKDRTTLELFLLGIGGGLLVNLLWEYSSFNNRGAYGNAQSFQNKINQPGQWNYEEPLLEGKAGTIQTLDKMAALVRRDSRNPRVHEAALQIVRNVRGHDFEGEIRALFEFVRDSIRYRKDPINSERVQDTERTIYKFKAGDCDDKSVALASLLGSLGHRSRFRVLGFSARNFSHVYLEVLTQRGWVTLDPTPEKAAMGWEAQAPIRQSFEIFG